MGVASCLICLLMAGQPLRSQSLVEPEREAAAPLVPVHTPKDRLTPEKLLAQAMTPPERQPLPGRPITLLEALSRSVGRARQLEVIRSYWRVALSVAEYNFSRDEFDQFQAMAARIGADPALADSPQANLLLLEQAAASARLRDAELRAVAAQSELADRLTLSPGDPLPLAADSPLSGAYRTLLDQLFAGRVPPPRLRLIDRLLPLRHQTIEARTEAVQAVSDALEAAKNQYQRREVEGDAIAEHLRELSEQRKAFLAVVGEYNFEIGEYALATAPETATPATLIPMLIKSKPPAAAATPPSPPETDAQPQPPAEPSPEQAKADPELRSILVRPGEAAVANEDLRKQEETRLKLSANSQEEAHEDGNGEPPAYAELLSVPSNKRIHRLTRLMHADRSLPQPRGTATSLSECLAIAPPERRNEVIASYWQTREMAARYQAVTDRLDQLAALLPVALEQTERPGAAEAVLELRAAQVDAKADQLSSLAQLWTSQHELSTLVGRTTRPDALLLPSTPPHGGRYQLHTDVQPRTLPQARQIAQLSDAIPALYALLGERSESAARADQRRRDLVSQLPEKPEMLGSLLEMMDRKFEESQAFLAALTRYNNAIAQYVLAVMPPATPPPQLAAQLVVQP